MNFPRPLLAALLLGVLAARASARTDTFYVAPGGNDRGSGAASEPLRSLPAAIEKARQARHHGANDVRIFLRGGDYPLAQTLVLTQKDSGLLIAAGPDARPVVTGETELHRWSRSPGDPGVWQTEIPEAGDGKWVFHELFVNGRRQSRTRVPEAGFFRVDGSIVTNQPTQLRFHPGDIHPEWAGPGDVEVIAYTAWAQTRNQLRRVLPGASIAVLAGQALANTAESNPRFFIENAPVPLRPGQWRLDSRSGLLRYRPEAGEDMTQAKITAPRLTRLIEIRGKAGAPARDIVFRGITFAGADWELDGGSDIDPQAATERPAAVQARFARDCAFERCAFERLGGYALELGRGCQDDKITRDEFRDLGAGGIRVGEQNMDGALSSPCGGHLISDNHIHDIGLVNAPGVGILVQLSASNLVSHNEIDHTFYTAVSVGWTWGYIPTPCRGNIVEYNHLHDIGQGMLSDMGGVYTLGLQPGAVVRNNLIHDINDFIYGGWGLYTDEGSTGILFESNIVYHCQAAGFHQHYGRDNILRNNIFAFNREGQLARTRVQTGISFIFTNNIVYFDTGAMMTGSWGDDLEMDRNFYFDTRAAGAGNRGLEALDYWRKRGHDLHSQYADPLFVDPRRFDFRLRPNSPALRAGFGQIDMTGVGVRPASAKNLDGGG